MQDSYHIPYFIHVSKYWDEIVHTIELSLHLNKWMNINKKRFHNSNRFYVRFLPSTFCISLKQLSELFVTAGVFSVGKMCITISEMLQYMYMYLSFTCSKRTWHRSQFKFSGLFHWILYTANIAIYMYDTHMIRYTCTYDTHMILIWKAIHMNHMWRNCLCMYVGQPTCFNGHKWRER